MKAYKLVRDACVAFTCICCASVLCLSCSFLVVGSLYLNLYDCTVRKVHEQQNTAKLTNLQHSLLVCFFLIYLDLYSLLLSVLVSYVNINYLTIKTIQINKK